MKNRMMLVAPLAFLSVFAAAALSVACSDDPTGPAPIVYTAVLNAANEVGTVNSTATGTATLTLRSNDSLDYVVMATGLTSAVIASHIHVGVAGANGNVVNGFTIVPGTTTGTAASGTVVLSQVVLGPQQVSGDSVKALINGGKAYVNVHTGTNTGGEIRGQVVRQ